MKVIVDTSVWSPALRHGARAADSNVKQLYDLLSSGVPVYLLGVILQEILQGLKHREQFLKVKRYLEPFPLIELTRADYAQAAELGFNCRRKGVHSGTIDFLIAGAAIQYGCHLLTSDQDFLSIANVSTLQVLV